MATQLSPNANFSLAAVALEPFIDTVTITGSADSLDVTTFGNLSHRKQGGLKDGTIAIGGTYDDAAASTPRTVIDDAIGTVVAFVWQPEGDATHQVSGNVLVVNYVESAPVADIVRWTASLERDGDWTFA
jgi:hypothetical protein